MSFVGRVLRKNGNTEAVVRIESRWYIFANFIDEANKSGGKSRLIPGKSFDINKYEN